MQEEKDFDSQEHNILRFLKHYPWSPFFFSSWYLPCIHPTTILFPNPLYSSISVQERADLSWISEKHGISTELSTSSCIKVGQGNPAVSQKPDET